MSEVSDVISQEEYNKAVIILDIVTIMNEGKRVGRLSDWSGYPGALVGEPAFGLWTSAGEE